eukprot:scaffold68537_cov23-Tisochrysis_lutea.AAC.1
MVDMGFPRNRVELALRRVGVNSIEAATEWLLAHPEEPPAAPAAAAAAAAAGAGAAPATTTSSPVRAYSPTGLGLDCAECNLNSRGVVGFPFA